MYITCYLRSHSLTGLSHLPAVLNQTLTTRNRRSGKSFSKMIQVLFEFYSFEANELMRLLLIGQGEVLI
jgi:hypothetical protein